MPSITRSRDANYSAADRVVYEPRYVQFIVRTVIITSYDPGVASDIADTTEALR